MKQIKSGDESYSVDVTFYNGEGDLSVPASISYTIYNVTEEAEVVASTAVSPAATFTISLNGDAVLLQDSSNKRERNRICVTAIDSSGNSIPRTFEYEVIPNTDSTCG
jgi:hypothetical protein